MNIPAFWKSELSDIDQVVGSIKKGKVTTSYSAGKRPVYLIEYGEKNNFNRTANLSSAAGSGEIKCYADKTNPLFKPCLFLVGAMHGAEFEGTAAILNLINIIETGKDFAGTEYPAFAGLEKEINLLLIPCLNPDGRARVPFKSVLGMSFEEFRYYAQGTWKDKSLAGWPDCKKIHPIIDYADRLGGYYNDDGINIMHDDFFSPMAAETKLLLDVAGEYAPDATVLLHGGTNAPNMLLQPSCVPMYFKYETQRIALSLEEKCSAKGLKTLIKEIDLSDVKPPFVFNAVSAVTVKCGELCFTYETNQGLDYGNLRLSHDEIYLHHMLLFEEMLTYIKNLKERRISDRKCFGNN